MFGHTEVARHFLMAGLSITLIDPVLAGDNAVVIATFLEARLLAMKCVTNAFFVIFVCGLAKILLQQFNNVSVQTA